MLTYKSYTAEINVDIEAGLLRGQVLDIKDVVTFEGKTVEDATQDFHRSVDEYLKFCEQLGQKPDKPFSGRLLFRTSPDIHRSIYLAANKAGKSINSWIEGVVQQAAGQSLGSSFSEPSSDHQNPKQRSA
ncbi:MAG: type II toxin-antitoxin system HicB family antitoxin [Elainellaceae cyanobacterium]